MIRWSRLAVPIAIVGLVAAACSSGGANAPRRRQRQRSAPASRARKRPGQCRGGDGPRLHRQQGHDARRGQGGDRRRGQPDRRQLDLHGQRRAGQAVPGLRQGRPTAPTSSSTTKGRQAPSVYLTALYAAAEGRQPVAVRRHGDRGELLGRGHGQRRWSTASCRPGLVPNQDLVIDQFQHVADVDRLPVDRLPGDRLQQAPAPPFIKSIKDLADPRLKGKVTLPAAR